MSCHDGIPAMRARYTEDEDKRIIQYIIENELYDRVKGRAMWEGMEIALGKNEYRRSALSLKERFCKFIIYHLKDYEVNPKVICSLLEPFKHLNKVEESPKKRRKTIKRKYYSSDDDKVLLNTAKEMKGDISGNKLWKVMEQRNVLEGRSWSSLRNRFLAHIIPHLDSLTDPKTAHLLRKRMKGDKSTDEPCKEMRQDTRKRSPTKKRKTQLLPTGFREFFKSPLRRDTPQRLQARLATMNRLRKSAQKPHLRSSISKRRSLLDLNSSSLKPSPKRKNVTALSLGSGNSDEEVDGSNDDLEGIVDPLYMNFVDYAPTPFVEMDGEKVKLNDLGFPIVNLF